MTEEVEEGSAETVRVLRFQGQTGFDATVLKTSENAYAPQPSDPAARITYTISYSGADGTVDPREFERTFPDAIRDAAVGHVNSLVRK